MIRSSRLACAALLGLLVLPGSSTVWARQSQQPGIGGRRMQAAEVQRLFDAYTLLQAQDALRLTEAQYGQFVARMKALQDVRRRNQQTRTQILRDLSRLTGGSGVADASIKQQLRVLAEHDAEAAADLRKAYAAVDEVLDPGQQARFRLFEESMERKKFDLLMRARQRARARLNP